MKPTTLFDDVYRATFSPVSARKIGFVDQPVQLRADLREARRFVLDDAMSAFLVDLSTAVFMGKLDKIVLRMTEQMRVLARLPFHRTWIEHSSGATTRRSVELGFNASGTPDPAAKADPADLSEELRQGWLLDQCADDDSLFRVHMFERDWIDGKLRLYAVPLAYAWRTDDRPGHPSWSQKAGAIMQSELIVGVRGYQGPCGIVPNMYLNDPHWMLGSATAQAQSAAGILKGYRAVLRRIWALLATINELPIGMRDITVAKGFIARGRYQQYLDYKTVVLNVPQNADLRKIARSAVAHARMRAHQVRGHWRRDYRHPGQLIWVHEHQRGDASLGFVMHDYAVERGADVA